MAAVQENSSGVASPKKRWLPSSLLAGFVILVSIVYFFNLSQVPFHPDESTQLFMSVDTDLLLRDPSSLSWHARIPADARMLYRLLDAPFARTWIGTLRLISGFPALAADWNWSDSWAQNLEAGAFPTGSQVLIGRIASAVFFPLDLLLLFLIGRKLHGNLLGWLMVILFSLNALVLLHSRRAMSEGPLLFFMILSIWCFLQNPRFLYLSAIPAALAFNSKYSALPLIFIGLFALVYRNWTTAENRKRLFIHIPVYLLIFLGITFTLNPFLWREPFPALMAALAARKELLARQIQDLGSVSQDWISNSFGKRLGSLIANLYLTPPAYHDVGNYIQQTLASEDKYQSIFYQNLFRGIAWGSLTLVLAVLGYIFGWLRVIKKRFENNPLYLILLIGTLLQFFFLLWAFSIPFQRYILPMIPYSTIWVAFATNELVDRIKNRQAA